MRHLDQPGGKRRRHRLRWSLIGVLVALVSAGGAFAFYGWSMFNDIERVPLERRDPPAVQEQEQSEGQPAESDVDSEMFVVPDLPYSEDGLDTVLLVGSDTRDGVDLDDFGSFEGERADVIMVFIRERATDRAALVSIPRDLYVSNPCAGYETRVNVTFEGCDELNGPSALLYTVEGFLGVGIDHIAMIGFDGFQHVVDLLGGYEICLDHPVRDSKARLDLPAGCTRASGEQTLAWMRSRNTQEQVDGVWRTMRGVNDLTRNERQREFFDDLMSRMGELTSLQDLNSLAKTLLPHVTVDDQLTLSDAIALAWSLRNIGRGQVEQLELPVYDDTGPRGAEILRAAVPPSEVIAEFLDGGVGSVPVTTVTQADQGDSDTPAEGEQQPPGSPAGGPVLDP